MALASRIRKIPYNVYVVMSDGECQEGSVWEAAMLAPRLELGSLAVLVDFNNGRRPPAATKSWRWSR